MEALFWCCLVFGALIAIITLIFGDVLGGAADGATGWLPIDVNHLFQPVVLSGAVTVFGGSGLLLDRYSSWPNAGVYAGAVTIAVAIGAGMYFIYVRPMRDSENSTGYSMEDLAGKRAEVLTSIPANGFGEVLVRVGAGNVNHTAASFDREEVPSGTAVVVVEVKEGTLYVSRMD
ncbi:NfeD family protein [Cohnella lubricantis]|uniref:NfeD family protein n=1 Tax=Cohnella lubricantis TaxID=2163172 RepID=A0A841TDD0_9BACL|nr:NfeD family protein [Cohnella lubricantis]MBB6677240.1 NfeD family protein [Cohnella lubricantis]MBP2116949.1 membrane protein implicated in regulation of membrane protease activity [Cohnella lubricantis]